jgi:RNA polymerase sigma-70 factor (ECF subfamily)
MRADLTKAFELLQSGKATDLERALELLQNTVFSFSMTVCGHREDAEDTMQEVLVKAIPYLKKFDNPKALTAWLYTVARNRCWMSRRRSKFAPREHLSIDDLMPDKAELDHLAEMATAEPSPEHRAIVGQDKERLKQAILRVPPSYRLVLVLHDVEELTTEEIAQILNLKEGNVRVRLHRARLYARREFSHSTPSAAGQSGCSVVTKAPSRSRNCRRIFANLSEYLDGEMDGSLCEELEKHMAGCKPCELFLENLRSTIELAKTLPYERPDESASAALRARVAGKLESSKA